MRAVLLKDYDATPASLGVVEMPIPPLKHGLVLVRRAAAPINPSDLVFMKGQYGITKPLPVVPGFEGSGRVIASGGGWRAGWLRGQRVACHAPTQGHGTWAEYMVADADACIPLFKQTSEEQGACLIVNPMTALELMNLARDARATSILQTAAASAVGWMIGRLAQRYGMTSIHIVRRREQVDRLKDAGFDYVFDVNDPLFNERLAEACYKFKTRLAFDAVGGELTRRLAASMPPDSRIVVYGALSGEPCQMSALDLIFHQERLEGFWLSERMRRMTGIRKWHSAVGAQRLIARELQTRVQGRFPLEQVAAALTQYRQQRSDGKVLLVPHAGN